MLYYYRNRGILYEYSLPINSSKRNTTVFEKSKIHTELSTVSSTYLNAGNKPTLTTAAVLPSTVHTPSHSSEHIGQKIANNNKSNLKIERIPIKKTRMPKYSQSFTFNKHYMKMKKMRLLTRGKHGKVPKLITVSENSHNGNRLISKIPGANKSISHDDASENNTNHHKADMDGHKTKIISDSGVDYHAKILNKPIVQTKGTVDVHRNASLSTLVNASRTTAPPGGENDGISSGEEISRDVSEAKTSQYTTVGERGFKADIFSATQSSIQQMKSIFNFNTYVPLDSYSTTPPTEKAIGEHHEYGVIYPTNYDRNTKDQENEQAGVANNPVSPTMVSERYNEEDSFESLWPEVPSTNTDNQFPNPQRSNVHHLPNRAHHYVANSNVGSVRTSDVLPNKKHSNSIENIDTLPSASDNLKQNEFDATRPDNNQLGNSAKIEYPPLNPIDRHVIPNVPGRHVIPAYRHQQENRNNIQDPNYSWRIHGFTECTDTCGGGKLSCF